MSCGRVEYAVYRNDDLECVHYSYLSLDCHEVMIVDVNMYKFSIALLKDFMKQIKRGGSGEEKQEEAINA